MLKPFSLSSKTFFTNHMSQEFGENTFTVSKCSFKIYCMSEKNLAEKSLLLHLEAWKSTATE